MKTSIRPIFDHRSTTRKSKDRTQWFILCGYTTYLYELAVIFKLNPHTLQQRIKSGWVLEAALVAQPHEGWNRTTSVQLAQQPWVSQAVKSKLDQYFRPTRRSK